MPAVALGVPVVEGPTLPGRPDDSLSFSDAALCGLAADLLPSVRPSLHEVEGPQFSVTVSPGCITLAASDLARRERSVSQEVEAAARDRIHGVTWDCACVQRMGPQSHYFEYFRPEHGDWVPCDHAQVMPAEVNGASRITEWSDRSRARMRQRVAEADWSSLWRQGHPVMMTLTYPGEWLAFAPSAKIAKGHLAALVERYFRAFGFRPSLLWKLEFQRRGAPHFHVLLPLPARFASLDPERFARVAADLDRARTAYRVAGGPKGRAKARQRVAFHWSALREVGSVRVGGLSWQRGDMLRLADFRAWVAASWSDVICAREADIRGGWEAQGFTALEAFDLFMAQRDAGRAAGTAVDMREGARMRDPKRIATYFLKHSVKSSGDKEYQHVVPLEWCADWASEVTGEICPGGDGPGRFWGFQCVSIVRETRYVSVRDFVALRRFLRRWGKSQHRNVCRRQRLSGGWVLVNDGPAAVSILARVLALSNDGSAVGQSWGYRLSGVGRD